MKLPATLTLSNASAALQSLRPTAGSGPWAIDASALREFDSAVLALLLQARRLAQAEGRALQVQDAPPKLADLAQLYGVAALLGLEPGD
jgi:phospholipid transport system transporter-binding protein